MINVEISICAYLFILPKKYCNSTFGGYFVEKRSSGLNSIFEFCPNISVKIVDMFNSSLFNFSFPFLFIHLNYEDGTLKYKY